jgi:hypothetical protein
VKRLAEGKKWDDPIGKEAETVVQDLLNRVAEDDPVKGKWNVKNNREGVIWCDASDLGIGVALEINGVRVEDAAWLRKREDRAHINLRNLRQF